MGVKIFCTELNCKHFSRGDAGNIRYESEDALSVHGSSLPMQTFIAFQISLTDLICSNSVQEEINPAPPEIGYGRVLAGWLTRDQELPRTSRQKIEFTELSLIAGKRGDASYILSEAVIDAKDKEPNTLSLLLVEDSLQENILHIFARFTDQAAADAHKNAGFIESVSSSLQSSKVGMYQEVVGFLSKTE